MSWNLCQCFGHDISPDDDCHTNVCWIGIIDAVSDLIFIVDIVVIFRTALIIQERGQTHLVTDCGLIAREYLSSYFIFDLLSVGAPFLIFFEDRVQEDPVTFRVINALGLFKVGARFGGEILLIRGINKTEMKNGFSFDCEL